MNVLLLGAEGFLDQAPGALFVACRETGVGRVIRVSALGADTGAASRFHLSQRADDYLGTLDLEWVIVQPAFAYGLEGANSRMFRQIASLPLLPVPGSGQQSIQPIHIDDAPRGQAALIIGFNWSREGVKLQTATSFCAPCHSNQPSAYRKSRCRRHNLRSSGAR